MYKNIYKYLCISILFAGSSYTAKAADHNELNNDELNALCIPVTLPLAAIEGNSIDRARVTDTAVQTYANQNELTILRRAITGAYPVIGHYIVVKTEDAHNTHQYIHTITNPTALALRQRHPAQYRQAIAHSNKKAAYEELVASCGQSIMTPSLRDQGITASILFPEGMTLEFYANNGGGRFINKRIEWNDRTRRVDKIWELPATRYIDERNTTLMMRSCPWINRIGNLQVDDEITTVNLSGTGITGSDANDINTFLQRNPNVKTLLLSLSTMPGECSPEIEDIAKERGVTIRNKGGLSNHPGNICELALRVDAEIPFPLLSTASRIRHRANQNKAFTSLCKSHFSQGELKSFAAKCSRSFATLGVRVNPEQIIAKLGHNPLPQLSFAQDVAIDFNYDV